MQRTPNPWKLTAAFLLLSALLAVLVLAVRNLYDDEIFTLYLVTGRARDILSITAQGDVHPPGMYLLAHLAWLMVPSFRWMNLVPGLVLYAGLAVFLFQVVPLFVRTRSRLCLLLLATLHPQLLMWGMTFRWYSWWTGIALIVLTVALQPRHPRPSIGTARAALLGLLLACLFYLNYITLLFALSLAVAVLVRYRTRPVRSIIERGFLAAGVFLVLIAPQFHTMLTVHLRDGAAQRSGLIVSFLRLMQSVAVSEAYVPWHPLGIAAGLVFTFLCLSGMLLLLRQESVLQWLNPHREGSAVSEPEAKRSSVVFLVPKGQPPSSSFVRQTSSIGCIVLFGVVFFLLVAVAGLGGKPRNGLLLVPVLAPAAALVLRTLRPRIQTGALLFFALWSAVGISHLLGRYGLTKSERDDHPEQVLGFIEQRLSQPGSSCAVVVTYDGPLAFDLAQAHLSRLMIVSPFQGPNFGGSPTLLPQDCAHPRLYVVESYLTGSVPHVDAFNRELQIAEGYIHGPRGADRFSFDSDAAIKRRMAQLPVLGADLQSVARLPDYRYVVTSGVIDRANVEAMYLRMPHFVSESEAGPDEDPTEQRFY